MYTIKIFFNQMDIIIKCNQNPDRLLDVMASKEPIIGQTVKVKSRSGTEGISEVIQK